MVRLSIPCVGSKHRAGQGALAASTSWEAAMIQTGDSTAGWRRRRGPHGRDRYDPVRRWGLALVFQPVEMVLGEMDLPRPTAGAVAEVVGWV